MTPHPVRGAAILAGGSSSRMGRNKALLLIDGKPLVQHTAATLQSLFPQVVVVTSNLETATAAGVPAIPDSFPDRGPAAGIHAALKHYQSPTFVIACDMPYLSSEVIGYLLSQYQGEPAAVPCGLSGPEPLHAVYGPQCLERLQAFLSTPKPPPLRQLLREIGTVTIPDSKIRQLSPDFKCFANWNSPEDLPNTSSP